MATRWFAFVGTLFLFIWFSNMIGYLPLPTNTEHKIDIFGIDFPAFALYAATANISVTLVLTLVVWFSLPHRGRAGEGPDRLPQELGAGGSQRVRRRCRSS